MGIRKPAGGYPFAKEDTWTSQDGRVARIFDMYSVHIQRTIEVLRRKLGPEELVYEMNHAQGKDVREAFPEGRIVPGTRRYKLRAQKDFAFKELVRLRDELAWRASVSQPNKD
jgi:hypothetical protein